MMNRSPSLSPAFSSALSASLPSLLSPRPSEYSPGADFALPISPRRSKSQISARNPSGRSNSKRAAPGAAGVSVVRGRGPHYRRRRTRSVDSLSHSIPTSGRDFSMADLGIDLAQLAAVKNNSGMKNVTHRQLATDLDDLGSEEDGPPDFTLNMEKWMRGTEMWKKKEKEHGGEKNGEEKPERDVDDCRNDEGERKEKGVDQVVDEDTAEGMEEEQEESDFVPLSTSTPAPRVAIKDNMPEEPMDAAAAVDHRRTFASRPSSQLHAEPEHATPAEEASYRIFALRAKIERLEMEGGNEQLVKESLQIQNSALRDEVDELRDEMSNMRNSISKMRQQAKIADKEREAEHKSQEEAKPKGGSLRDKSHPLLQELAIARSTAEVERSRSEAKITTLEEKLQSLQESLMKQQIDFRCSQERNNCENLTLRSELDICKGESKAYQQTLRTREEDHKTTVAILQKKLDAVRESQSKADVLKMELDHALEQLTETRRIVDTIEDENDRLTRENERQRDELNATTAVVDGKEASIAAAKSTIEELQDEISRIKGEKNIGLIEEDVHEAQLKQYRQQHRALMHAAQATHEQRLKGLEATILRNQDGTRRREARAQKSHREEVSALNQEIATLKCRLKTQVEAPGATIADHRNAIRMLSHKLDAANETILTTRHTLAEAHKSLAVGTNEIDRLKKHYEVFQVAANKHYQGACQKREQEWQKKMDAVMKERKEIVKQLFILWSREEMGIAPDGEKRPYRFKYVRRNGEGISQPVELDKNGKLVPFPGEKVKEKNKEQAVSSQVVVEPPKENKTHHLLPRPLPPYSGDHQPKQPQPQQEAKAPTNNPTKQPISSSSAIDEERIRKMTEREETRERIRLIKAEARARHQRDHPHPAAANLVDLVLDPNTYLVRDFGIGAAVGVFGDAKGKKAHGNTNGTTGAGMLEKKEEDEDADVDLVLLPNGQKAIKVVRGEGGGWVRAGGKGGRV